MPRYSKALTFPLCRFTAFFEVLAPRSRSLESHYQKEPKVYPRKSKGSSHAWQRRVFSGWTRRPSLIEDRPADPRFIVTVHRAGYKFVG